MVLLLTILPDQCLLFRGGVFQGRSTIFKVEIPLFSEEEWVELRSDCVGEPIGSFDEVFYGNVGFGHPLVKSFEVAVVIRVVPEILVEAAAAKLVTFGLAVTQQDVGGGGESCGEVLEGGSEDGMARRPDCANNEVIERLGVAHELTLPH